jgi:hypothetical protein
MTEHDGAKAPAAADDERAARRQRSERLSQTMWAYICGGITVVSFAVGFGASFLPLGFGVLGCVLAWQLFRSGERRHSTIAGALALGGIMIWFTYNWPMLHRYLAG